MSHQSSGESVVQGVPVLTAVEQAIGPELLEAEQILAEELHSSNPYVCDILHHSTRFRGKRLRPMLLLLTAKATGGIRQDHKILSAVVEMIHLATLVHDDVLDEAETRRHVATVNSRWNNETSVLFGDYLFTHSFHLASSLDTTYACRRIGRATNIVCEGELSQIKERGNLDLTEEAYFKIIDGKTAELTALCGHLGAYYSQSDPSVVAALEQYGRSLGLAFQIADDVLDLMGSEGKIGKSLGSDLLKQKLTLPLIRLLQTASEQESQEIRQLLAHPDETTRSRLTPYFERSDAFNYTSRVAKNLASEARNQLELLPQTPARRILADIAEFAVQRTF
ncbi:polyprenyl synthetase family protein [Schlesneria sp.]|uniref:polyprenyl synthetase family protein n=1 Tax=Schlesneria sp. TaxID=2762018 RepID=UPI002F136246